MNNMDRIYKAPISGAEYASSYTAYLSELMAKLDFGTIENVIDLFWKARTNDKTIFFIGNGGSAATCSHFAEDLVGGTVVEGKRLFRALSLVDNNAFLTALGNDEGYDQIFVWQLRSLLSEGDIVVAISGSGNSPNLLRAVEYTNANGGITVGIVGFDGGELKKICHHNIHAIATKGEYAPVEDIHLVLGHIICTYLMYKVREGEL
jgi:D-sedoheptulose 7-phosphate isomerase